MKQTIFILLIASMLSSCNSNSQTKATEKAMEIQSAIKPGTVATNSNDYTMTAKIDSKDWVASSMMPPEAAGRIVGHYENEYIGLPYSKTDMVVGKKISIDEDNAVDLSLNDGCLYTNTKGEIEITKVGDSWAEGKFFFTTICSSTNKAVEVTDGFFRIPISKN
jgi:hypothetical protein